MVEEEERDVEEEEEVHNGNFLCIQVGANQGWNINTNNNVVPQYMNLERQRRFRCRR